MRIDPGVRRPAIATELRSDGAPDTTGMAAKPAGQGVKAIMMGPSRVGLGMKQREIRLSSRSAGPTT